jgi:hypothetical protein
MTTHGHLIEPGTLVRHIDGRHGRVLGLVAGGPLPQATVRWFGNNATGQPPQDEIVPLGYLERQDLEAE